MSSVNKLPKQNYVQYYFYGYKSKLPQDDTPVLLYNTKISTYVSPSEQYIETKTFIKMQCYLQLFHSDLHIEYEVQSFNGSVLEEGWLEDCFNKNFEEYQEPSSFLDMSNSSEHLLVGMA